MVVELRPLGVKCNIQCQYCYQNPQRDAGNILHQYNFDAMMAAVEREGGEFALFGGEPLLLPLPELERLWALGLARSGWNNLQTNGTLITDAHIDLFRRYKVSVGISLDGPGELNDARWAGTAERTRGLTARVEAIIERLCRESTPPRLIVTLHRGNAAAEKLPTLLAWFRTLHQLGVCSVRIHLLEVDHADVRTAYALTPEENRAAIEALADLQRELPVLRFDLFEDMRLMLLGKDESTTCVWNACDPYTTRAVRGVEGNGQSSNCGRTNKEGIDFVKAPVEGFERYLALYHTPQENGGCKGCRFFLMCKGQCPGTGVDNDWRNRSEHCEAWKWAYARMEDELTKAGEEPLSLSPLRDSLEACFLETWKSGRNTIMAHAQRTLASTPMAPTPPAHRLAPASAGPFCDRLDFTLPPFTRISWVSDAAREVWGPRLQRIRAVEREMAWRSVASGLRRCAILLATEEQIRYPASTPWHAAGLAAAPLGTKPGNGTVGVAVGLPADLEVLAQARESGDDRLIGDLLGQPDCCRAFHRRVWVHDGVVDVTWPQALASGGMPCGDKVLQIAGLPQSNPLWRWLGLQPAFHLPCQFGCRKTVEIAERVFAAARAAGFTEEVGWFEDILGWPVEWSALHGIAEIRTPILKIATNTDATAGLYAVRLLGDRYPSEGARGVRFPYQATRPPLLTLSVDYRRGLAHATGQPHEEST
jgi:uncharacterized protein